MIARISKTVFNVFSEGRSSEWRELSKVVGSVLRADAAVKLCPCGL